MNGEQDGYVGNDGTKVGSKETKKVGKEEEGRMDERNWRQRRISTASQRDGKTRKEEGMKGGERL